jgi:lipoate-protein ligase A
MLLYHLETHDPFFNLAVEEVLLRESKEEYVLLGVNVPSVIIGKHQVAHMETDTKFVSRHGIPVIRRISGGGTVFHDSGNLNFTFIRNCEEGKQVDFRKHTRPVIDFLRSYDIDAAFAGKNDIRVDGLKISGNAEHVLRNRVLHHGTLLFSSSLKMLRGSIRNDKSGYSTRAVNSNPASVMNLCEKLSDIAGIGDLAMAMINYFIHTIPDLEISDISQLYKEKGLSLADSKYRSWEWNFAYGPDYDFRNSFMHDGRLITCSMTISGGIVRKCIIEGSAEMSSVSELLTGCRHMTDDFRNIFSKEKLPFSENEIFNFF